MFLLFQKRFLLLKRCFQCVAPAASYELLWSYWPCTFTHLFFILFHHGSLFFWCCASWWHYSEGLLQCNEINKPKEKPVDFLVLVQFLISLIAGTFLNVAGPACDLHAESRGIQFFQPTSAITESRCVRTLAHSE